jgi:polysaccharide pyruvyl transferase WcaK-like protein
LPVDLYFGFINNGDDIITESIIAAITAIEIWIFHFQSDFKIRSLLKKFSIGID